MFWLLFFSLWNILINTDIWPVLHTKQKMQFSCLASHFSFFWSLSKTWKDTYTSKGYSFSNINTLIHGLLFPIYDNCAKHAYHGNILTKLQLKFTIQYSQFIVKVKSFLQSSIKNIISLPYTVTSPAFTWIEIAQRITIVPKLSHFFLAY